MIEEVFDFVAYNLGHESSLIIPFRNLNKIFRLKLKSTICSIRESKQIQNQDQKDRIKSPKNLKKEKNHQNLEDHLKEIMKINLIVYLLVSFCFYSNCFIIRIRKAKKH